MKITSKPVNPPSPKHNKKYNPENFCADNPKDKAQYPHNKFGNKRKDVGDSFKGFHGLLEFLIYR